MTPKVEKKDPSQTFSLFASLVVGPAFHAATRSYPHVTAGSTTLFLTLVARVAIYINRNLQGAEMINQKH